MILAAIDDQAFVLERDVRPFPGRHQVGAGGVQRCHVRVDAPGQAGDDRDLALEAPDQLAQRVRQRRAAHGAASSGTAFGTAPP